MLRLKAHDIHSVRAVATWLARLAAVVLLVMGAYLALKRVLIAILTGDITMIHLVWEGAGDQQGFYRGIGMVAAGVAMALLSRKIARWVVVVPEEGCPRCGYAVDPATRGQCPECGYTDRAPGA